MTIPHFVVSVTQLLSTTCYTFRRIPMIKNQPIRKFSYPKPFTDFIRPHWAPLVTTININNKYSNRMNSSSQSARAQCGHFSRANQLGVKYVITKEFELYYNRIVGKTTSSCWLRKSERCQTCRRERSDIQTSVTIYFHIQLCE